MTWPLVVSSRSTCSCCQLFSCWIVPIIDQQNCKKKQSRATCFALSLSDNPLNVCIYIECVAYLMACHHFPNYLMVIQLCILILRKTNHSYCWLCMPQYPISPALALPVSHIFAETTTLIHVQLCLRNCSNSHPVSISILQYPI